MNSRVKVRLSIDCSPEERKCIKILAAQEDKTISEYLICLARDKIASVSIEDNTQRVGNHEHQTAGLLADYYKALGY